MNIEVRRNDGHLISHADHNTLPTKDTPVKYAQNSKNQVEWWLVELDASINDPDIDLSIEQVYLELKEAALPAASSTVLSLNELVQRNGISNVLNRAIQQNNIFVVKDLIKHYPKKIKAAVAAKDLLGLTPAFWAVIKGEKVYEYLSLLHKAAPEEFKSSVDTLGLRDCTLLSLLVHQHALHSIKFLAQVAPTQFANSVRLRNAEGHTPVALAVIERDMRILKIMAEYAQDEFKSALTLQDEYNETAVSLASGQIAMLKFMYTICSESFMKASNLRNDLGMSILDNIKKLRTQNYKEITGLFPKDSLIKKIQKEIFKRMALSHFFNISGSTDITEANTGRHCATVDLEGWRSPQWFNLIEKYLHEFQQTYPNCLKSILEVVRNACRYEADHNSYTLRQNYEALKSRKGPFCSFGFFRHEVTLVVWEDWLAICNRGEGARGGLEFFRFNSDKLDFETFKKLLELSHSTKENYEKVLYDEVAKKLEFTKTKFVKDLEEYNNLFQEQEVGNCSLVSPITGLYALCLIVNASMMKISPVSLEFRMKEALDWYIKWLNFQRMCVLARSIEPLKNDPHFKPDHELISKCLVRAHQLKLDAISSKRLMNLTDSYFKCLDLKQKIDLRLRLKKNGSAQKIICL